MDTHSSQNRQNAPAPNVNGIDLVAVDGYNPDQFSGFKVEAAARRNACVYYTPTWWQKSDPAVLTPVPIDRTLGLNRDNV